MTAVFVETYGGSRTKGSADFSSKNLTNELILFDFFNVCYQLVDKILNAWS